MDPQLTTAVTAFASWANEHVIMHSTAHSFVVATTLLNSNDFDAFIVECLFEYLHLPNEECARDLCGCCSVGLGAQRANISRANDQRRDK